MRYVCNSCNKQFSTSEKSKCCPYCMSIDIEYTGKASAIKMINKYNELESKMNDLMENYIPLYLESETIRATLRTYKSRGIITEKEFPVKKRPQIQAMVSEYRKQKK